MPLLKSYLNADLSQRDRAALDDLVAHGIKTDASLIMDPNAAVAKTSGRVSKAVIESLLDKIILPGVLHNAPSPARAVDFEQERNLVHITSGWKQIDELLGGQGWACGEVSEICGSSSTGKTQLCLHAMVNLLVQSKTSRAIWIDTLDGGFSARRTSDVIRAYIARLATERVEMTLTEDRIVDILSRIHVYACRDIYDVIGVVETIRSSCDKTSSEQVQPAQLIVIDSLTTVLTGLLHGTDGAGHATMMHTARELRGLARDFNIAVLVTTLSVQMSYPEEQSPSILMTSNNKPSLGSSWRYATDLQLFLTRLSRVRRHQWQQQPANVLTGEARVVARSDLFGDEVDESAIRVPEDGEGFASMRVAEIMKSKRLRIGEWSLFNLAPGHGNGM